MNILWLSVAPFAPTGYGTQTAQATARLRDAGHNVGISVSYGLQYAELDYEGMPLYPADHTTLNKRMLPHHVAKFAKRCGCSPAEVQVISLFDIWPWIDPNYGGMADFKGLNIAAWLPVDSLPVTTKTRAALDAFDVKPIAMSRFGEEQLKLAGYDPLYVPHGIDTNLYAPRPDRAMCKQVMGIDPDKFVVGMVAHNQGMQPARKAFPNVLQAFAAFHREHVDSVLYLHTEPTGTAYNGLNLLAMARQMFGIPEEAIAIVPQIPYLANEINPIDMSHIYSAMDVLANPSYGEGFGLPIIEAQACGTPVVVTAFSAMPELVGAGWKVGGSNWYNESTGAYWAHPSTEEIYAAFKEAYELRDDQALRDQAREFAVGYDADRVFEEHWVPALEQLGRPREVPPLPFAPNREQRRRIAKAAA